MDRLYTRRYTHEARAKQKTAYDKNKTTEKKYIN